MADVGQGEAAARYRHLEARRQPYLYRARECAKLTIPTLLPESDTAQAANIFPTPYQSMGARGVNNLASKTLLALFPPNEPFFRLRIPSDITSGIPQADLQAFDEALAEIERRIAQNFEETKTRVSLFEVLKHLIVAGNVLIFMPPEGGLRVFKLNQYVAKRDPKGNLLECVTHEQIAPAALPPEIKQAVADYLRSSNKSDATHVDLYTWLRRDGDRFIISQEVCGFEVPGSKGTYPVDTCPWLALRWVKVDGEDYGRGHVEEYIGDLKSLEGLMQAIVEGSEAAAKMITLVNPNGLTDLNTIADAPNLAVRAGRAEDVTFVRAEKATDFRVAQEVAMMIQQRLAQAFLLVSSVQRDAERVTAEEIRLMASELEDALGGVYSVFAQELQLPLVRVAMARLQKAGVLPALPKDSVQIAVITGLEALGRGHNLNRLMMWGNIMNQTFGEGAFGQLVNRAEFARTVAADLGVEIKGIVKTDEELAQEEAAARQAALLEAVGPEAIKRAAAADQAQPQQTEQA